MYVQSLTFDDWNGLYDLGSDVASPSLELIQSRIRALDGSRFTLVVLAAEGEAHIAIGGGALQRYIVYATYDGQRFGVARATSQSAGRGSPVQLIVGGQQGEYSAELTVSLEEALVAASAFAVEGKLDPSLIWKL